MGSNDISRLEWLQSRRAGIGGSEIGAILGLSRYRSPVDVWLDKTAQVEPDQSMSEAAYWGIELEATVAAEYAKRTGNKVQRVTQMMRHPDHDWMLANIDRAVVADGSRARINKDGRLDGIKGLLECKTASVYTERDWDDNNAPLVYVAQCQWYMAVTGAAWCDLAVLIGGQRYASVHIERDDDLIAKLIEAGQLFWRNHVLTGVPPQPRTPEETLALFPSHRNDSLAMADDDTLHALEAYRILKQQAAQLDAEMAVVKAAIQAAIGDHAGLCDPQGNTIATWRQNKPSQKTNWKAAIDEIKGEMIEAELFDQIDVIRDIIDRYTTEQPGARPLIIK